MLYDKRWDRAVTKPDVFSMEGLVAWLETKPATKTYDYKDCRGKCLYGLYMAAHGVSWDESGAVSSRDSGPARAQFCMHVYEHVAAKLPWTFGAALTRARAAVDADDLGGAT